jgi:hypothetical protein
MGTVLGVASWKGVAEILREYGDLPGTAPTSLGITVGELRDLAPWLRIADFIVCYGEAAVFAGLYVWARRSPYPALVTGAALFIVIQAVVLLLDVPVVQGGLRVGWNVSLVWTAIFLIVWGVAIREARAERR